MIIQIRGTSGSGKTTAMRKVMAELPKFTRNSLEPHFIEGRRRPLYYYDGGCCSILGSYEATCGGCDSISGYETLQKLVAERINHGHVLMEGLLLSEDSKQTILMGSLWASRNHGHPAGWRNYCEEVRCIFLTTPIEVCLERIRGRRAERGNDKPLNESNTRNRVATIARARVKLEAAGILCRSASADQAPRLVMSWLKG